MTELPSGTVTFLFTDLEGSTRLWEEHPDDMRVALARHDEILRKNVETHDGAIVKTTGDGLHAAFATADHALAAAVDAQLALTGEVWSLAEPLRVRMGIHTGAAEERDGDYYGPAVNRAARVAAAAHGGQILVSHASEELGRDSLPPGGALIDLGEHRLRDLARAERVFQLVAPGLIVKFPPPRSIDAYPGNLPVQLSSFIGRERDVASIADAVRDARLVTLTGVGGVGKTRLATQVAAELLPHFPDGAWLCELSPATDPDTLDQIVASALGVTPRESVTLRGSIVEFLTTRELLVVLDNCEHLLVYAGRLADALLRAGPGVRLLATSREGLGTEGEQIRVVGSLSIPDDTADPASIATADSARLFLDRARAVQGGAVDVDNDAVLHDVGEICRRLDGIPLAIELAAARAVSMAPGDIARNLDERFRLLTGGRRTAVERHHTLRATVDWSYSLLGDRERTVFDRLGVFSGTFDAAAAEVVAGGDDFERWDVLDALNDLVAKSMVNREARAGTSRFALLETLRQYARERLDEHDEADDVRRRHARHFHVIAEELCVGLKGPDEVALRTRLRNDLDNFRAAVTWGLDRDEEGDRAIALEIIANLALEANNDHSLGVGAWATRAAEDLEGIEPWIECAVLAVVAEDLRCRGEFGPALELAAAALTDVNLAGDGPLLAILVMSSILATQGEPGIATQAVLAAKAAIEGRQDSLAAVVILDVLASVWLTFAGDVSRATALAEEAVTLAHETGSPSHRASALFAAGHALHCVDPDAAMRDYEASVELTHRGAGDGAFTASLGWVALLHHERGDSATALDRAIECIRYAWDFGDQSQVQNGLASAAVILDDLGEFRTAATLLGGGTHTSIATNQVAEHDPRWNLAGVREHLRSELGASDYDQAWSRGVEMPTDAFVVFALAELQLVRASITLGSR